MEKEKYPLLKLLCTLLGDFNYYLNFKINVFCF